MKFTTKYKKRRNTVKLSLNIREKKITETMYMAPNNKLVRRLFFKGSSIREIADIYFEKSIKYNTLGYETDEKKNGKLIFIDFKQPDGVMT
ncbi:MAG: hypothetical protein GX308_09855 [Epulopiscium sp.]|nr:hypothetical protein [Candidatus Epulonipiscium sp.]